LNQREIASEILPIHSRARAQRATSLARVCATKILRTALSSACGLRKQLAALKLGFFFHALRLERRKVHEHLQDGDLHLVHAPDAVFDDF
jgi:hypothetical protein